MGTADIFREEMPQLSDVFYFNCPKESIPGYIGGGLDYIQFDQLGDVTVVVDGAGNMENRMDVDGPTHIFSMDILYGTFRQVMDRHSGEETFLKNLATKTYVRFGKKQQLWSFGNVVFEGYGRGNIFLMSYDPRKDKFDIRFPVPEQEYYSHIETFDFSVPKGSFLITATDGGMEAVLHHAMFKDYRGEQIGLKEFHDLFDSNTVPISLFTRCKSLLRPMLLKLRDSAGLSELKSVFARAQSELSGSINDDATFMIKGVK